MTTTLDMTPLTEHLNPSDIRRYREATKAAGQHQHPSIFSVIFLLAYGLMTLALCVFLVRGIMETLTKEDGRTDWALVVFGSLLTVLFLGFALLLMLVAKNELFGKNEWKRWMRLEKFAAANDLGYERNVAHPGFAGTIFQQGQELQILEHIYAPHTYNPDIGNYRYFTGSGKGRAAHDWGFVAVRLARRLPHIVLDATANNVLRSNLPSTFTRDQRLSLEGDFDKYFTLYCPAAYERDALYIITPDLMALLIDRVHTFDVEIVDDWLFLYSSRPLDLIDPAVIARLHRITENIGGKMRDTSALYADVRTAPEPTTLVDVHGQPLHTRLWGNEVDAGGRRLRTKPEVAAVITIGFLILAGAGSVALLLIYG